MLVVLDNVEAQLPLRDRLDDNLIEATGRGRAIYGRVGAYWC